MRPAARIAAAIELLENVNDIWQETNQVPADQIISTYMKERRYIGSKDRQFIVDLVYFIMRHGGALEYWLSQAKTEGTPRLLVLLALVMAYDRRPEEIDDLFDGEQYNPAPLNEDERQLLRQHYLQPLITADMPDWARYSYPDWIEPSLRESFGDEFDNALDSLNNPAPIDLRANTLKTTRADVIHELDRESILCAQTKYSPLGIRLNKRYPLQTLDIFKQGWFEIQDEGSQIVSLLVDARPGQTVIDYCAGAGGKTLAMATTMENQGTIYALDTSEHRLKKFPKRLERAGVTNVFIQPLGDNKPAFLKKHKGLADRVLLDVPCSGSGTWRRNPDLKWRFSRKDLQHVCSIQEHILTEACGLVKPGGRLIYVTCSILKEENQDQVARFLTQNGDFFVEELPEMWNNHVSLIENMGPALSLTPHRDGTDGFFAMVLGRHG